MDITLISITNDVLLTVAMVYLWKFYISVGFSIGYLSCQSPEPFQIKSLIFAACIVAAYFAFLFIVASIGIVPFVEQVHLFTTWTSCLFIVNAVVVILFYLPSYKVDAMLASLIFAAPFIVGVILIKIFHLA